MVTTQSSNSPVVAKQHAISEKLRRQIVAGVIPLGGRLPTQVKLVEEFGVSGVTVQRALDRLMREGFIYTRGRHGTFVAENPPHLCSFGLVFADRPQPGQHRSRYHEMLEAEALRLQRVGDRKVTVFNGISGHEDTEASRRLLDLVRTHQMAGLMLVDAEEVYCNTPLLDEPGICRAAILSRKVMGLSCPIVYPDMTGMIDLALDTLLKHGRKKVAILVTAPVFSDSGEYLRQAMRERGLIIHDRWTQIVPHEIPEAVRNTVLMLMFPQGDDRPDGLFIADDNLIEAASGGLVAAGVSVPQDVTVVAHCNFPWSASSVLPIQRVGFDTRLILETAVNVIETQRQHRRAPPVTQIAAVLEDTRR